MLPIKSIYSLLGVNLGMGMYNYYSTSCLLFPINEEPIEGIEENSPENPTTVKNVAEKI